MVGSWDIVGLGIGYSWNRSQLAIESVFWWSIGDLKLRFLWISMGSETDSIFIIIMNSIVVHKKRRAHDMEWAVLWEDHQKTKTAILSLTDIQHIFFRWYFDPLAIKHEEEGWEAIVAFSLYHAIFHFPVLRIVHVQEYSSDKSLIVQQRKVDGIGSSVNDCVYTRVFKRITVSRIDEMVCECIQIWGVADGNTLVVLWPEKVV